MQICFMTGNTVRISLACDELSALGLTCVSKPPCGDTGKNAVYFLSGFTDAVTKDSSGKPSSDRLFIEVFGRKNGDYLIYVSALDHGRIFSDTEKFIFESESIEDIAKICINIRNNALCKKTVSSLYYCNTNGRTIYRIVFCTDYKSSEAVLMTASEYAEMIHDDLSDDSHEFFSLISDNALYDIPSAFGV